MGFTFRLENLDGSPAEPPTLSTAVPNWSPGDTIPFGPDRALRVVEIRDGSESDSDPILVVETARRKRRLPVRSRHARYSAVLEKRLRPDRGT